MKQHPAPTPAEAAIARQASRAQAEARALRDNLARRKAQARQIADEPAPRERTDDAGDA